MKLIFNESLKLNKELNPKLWDKDNNLNEDVKEKLSEIIEQVLAELHENEIPINLLDVRIVGSNASYNYTSKSDLDLHLIVSTEDTSEDPVVLNLLYLYFKKIFNEKYNISIHGINVELYIEDIDDMVISNGVYSLISNSWIKFPQPLNIPNVDIKDDIDKIKGEYKSIKKAENGEDASKLLNKIYLMRKDSIEKEGEFGKGNLIFKELRDDGYIQKLRDLIAKGVSKDLSLESLKRLKEEYENIAVKNLIPIAKNLPLYIDNIYFDEENKKLYYLQGNKARFLDALFTLQHIQISDIVTLQEEVNKETVYEIMDSEDFKNKELFPIAVVLYNGKYILLDGNHRTNAYIINGEKTIEAKVFKWADIRKILYRWYMI